MSGGSRRGSERKIPHDSEVFREAKDYCLHVSTEAQCVVVETLDYHPGPLYLSRADLVGLLSKLDKAG